MRSFTVTAERSGEVWALQCVEDPSAISQAESLATAEPMIREAISLVTGLDESEIEVHFNLLHPDREGHRYAARVYRTPDGWHAKIDGASVEECQHSDLAILRGRMRELLADSLDRRVDEVEVVLEFMTPFLAVAKRWAELWEVHVDGVGVTQCNAFESVRSQALDLIASHLDQEVGGSDVEIRASGQPDYLHLASLCEVASDQWGLVTADQIEGLGISLVARETLVATGLLVWTFVDDVWRFSGASEHQKEILFATWLATGGPRARNTLVAAGETAADLWGMGDYLPRRFEFVSALPTTTVLTGVDVRHQQLDRDDVLPVQGLPSLTPAGTIGDLVATYGDLSLVARALNDAAWKHYLVRPQDLDPYLVPLAEENGYAEGDGAALRRHLYTLANLTEDGFPERSGGTTGARNGADSDKQKPQAGETTP